MGVYVFAGWELPHVFEYGGLGVWGRCVVDELVREGHRVVWCGCVPSGYQVPRVTRFFGGRYLAVASGLVNDLSSKDVASISISVAEDVARFSLTADAVFTNDHHVAVAALKPFSEGVSTVHLMHTVSGDLVEAGVLCTVGKGVVNSKLTADSVSTIVKGMTSVIAPSPPFPSIRVVYPAAPPLPEAGVADEETARKLRKIEGYDVVVGCVGRAGQWNKNHGLLWEVVKALRSEGVNAVGLLAGMGHEDGFDGYVLRIGSFPEDSKRAVYEAMDVFILPSKFEPFGMVALEAVEAGVPVAVSTYSGVAEVLRSAPQFNPENIESAAKAVLSAVGNDPLLDRLRREALSRTWEDVVKELLKIAVGTNGSTNA